MNGARAIIWEQAKWKQRRSREKAHSVSERAPGINCKNFSIFFFLVICSGLVSFILFQSSSFSSAPHLDHVLSSLLLLLYTRKYEFKKSVAIVIFLTCVTLVSFTNRKQILSHTNNKPNHIATIFVGYIFFLKRMFCIFHKSKKEFLMKCNDYNNWKDWNRHLTFEATLWAWQVL